ncbi:DUF3060 domain-containing protein [Massilia sp. CCM 8733]|uniref:DUF3060 domain-containing protein n=1 Tax=Massilia mucilaginosa TaxID=2609282 RepID=A0ABX0P079_9BURK|nr:DUF3060 domain-containing protein [Massilia mucilaginosa]NHZ92371.1 DUF3060 domain-containing protein [Massilia mucilaginosa]
MRINTTLRGLGLGLGLALTVSASALAQDKGIGAIFVQKDLIEVTGNGHHRTFPCNGRKVLISGTQHVLTFTGVCSSVEIAGAEHKVTVQVAPAGTLSVYGVSQQLNWLSTGEPTQEVGGADHKIVRLALKP